jgi:hypothetical protein
MNKCIIIILLLIVTAGIATTSFENAHAQANIDPLCVVRGESHPPPPFVVLRWDISGECNSTIDHFVHFYDIRSIMSNNTEYILFLESQ